MTRDYDPRSRQRMWFLGNNLGEITDLVFGLCASAMPRYFFDLHDDMDAPDTEGVELRDDAAAHARGVRESVHMAAAAVAEQRKVDLAHWVGVRRDSGQTFAKIRFEEVVRFERDARPI